MRLGRDGNGAYVSEDRGRRAPTGLWALAAAMGAVLLVGSAAGAPTVTPGTTTGPPYPGAPFSVFDWAAVGCVSLKDPVLPNFNGTTGHARVSVSTTTRGCDATNGTSVLVVAPAYQSDPVTQGTGHHNLTGDWTFNFAVNLTVHRASSSQNASAMFQVAVGFNVDDETTGGILGGPYSDWVVNHTITHGSWAHSYRNVHATTYINSTYNSTHVYRIYVIVEVIEETSVGPGTSTASVSVNMGTGGRSAFLSSVTFS